MTTFSRPYGNTYFQGRSLAKAPLESLKLDGEFNQIATWLNDNATWTQNISEWALFNVTPTYTSGTQFTVAGDATDIFTVTRAIKADLDGTDVYSVVDSASYSGGSGLTTVVLKDSVLTADLTAIYYGLINADLTTSSLPVTLRDWPRRSVSTDTTLTRYDFMIAVDASAANVVLTLPACSSLNTGKMYAVKKIDAGFTYKVTLDGNASETIDGSTTYDILTPNEGVIIINNGSNWEIISTKTGSPQLMRGYVSNLIIKNNATTPTTKLDISADAAVLWDSSGNLKYFASPSGTLDVTGTGAGKLDAGTFAASTWYYLYFIGKGDGTLAVLASTSATSPTLPSGYTYWLLVSAVYSHAGTAFYNIVQYGDTIHYKDKMGAIATSTANSYTSKDLSSQIPPIATHVQWRAYTTYNSTAGIAISWDNGGSYGYITFNLQIGNAVDSEYYGLLAGMYLLNPSAPQTIYIKGYDTNNRGSIATVAYKISIN